MSDQAPRACIGEDSIDFHGREARVQWNRDQPQPAARIYQLDVVGFIGEQKRQAVAKSKTVPALCPGNSRHTILKLAKG